MPESTVVKTKRDVTITLSDSGSAHTYTISYEPGDFAVDIPINDVLNFLDRGAMPAVPSVRKGDDQPITGSFTVQEREIGSAAFVALYDIINRPAGAWATTNWVSTIGTASDEVTYSITMTISGAALGGTDKSWVLPYCVIRMSRADGDPNTASISFTSYTSKYTLA